MNKKINSKTFRSLLTKLEAFFSSWRFPVFTLSVLFFFALLVIGISLVPVSDSGIGAFAEEFKTWCLGYDPATGEIESIYLVMFIVQPTMLSLFIWGFWFSPLSRLFKNNPRKAIPTALTGLSVVLLIGTTFPSLYTPAEKNELPFPAQELRTHIDPPEFTLINQNKIEISLSEFSNQVIMITAVYASCSETCPIILEQAQEVINELNPNEAKQIQLMAITMDPDKDTPKMLKMTADHYKLTGKNQHLLTGDSQEINAILDQLNIPRKRREDGRIDHANIFLLVDKTGKIAYRFTIGERQKKWLLKATRLLVSEPDTKSTSSADEVTQNL